MSHKSSYAHNDSVKDPAMLKKEKTSSTAVLKKFFKK